MADTTFVIIPGRDGAQKSAYPAGNAPISIGGSGALVAQAAAVAGVATGSAGGGSFPEPTLVRDTFESSDLQVVNGQNGNINNIGYNYPETNYTSIVGMNGSNPTRYYPLPELVFPEFDLTPYAGARCLRFRYTTDGNMAEQRFALGSAQRDIWFRYWVRVPTNFDHAPLGNHKFFALWMDAYEGSSPLLIWEFWNNGSGGSTLGYHFRPTGGSDGPHLDQQPFISIPGDRGRWMQVVIHAKASTNGSSNDGVIQLWRRWSNESAFTQLHNKTDANFTAVTNNGWTNGYFMGWANQNNYTTETVWLIDNVEVSDASLV